MRLIGVGLPRTGTLSQKVALEMLGCGPCYHMVNVLGDLDEVPKWQRALAGEADWPEILGGFQATVDWPGAYFYRQLLEAYPDAKVLLSVRDADAWAQSMHETIWGVLYGDILIKHLSEAQCIVNPKWRAYIDLMQEMWRRSGLIYGQEPDLDWMAAAMGRYHAEVRRDVPSERLLEWSVAEGWEPLCAFLDVPVPEMPFPHLNDTKTFNDRVVDGSLIALQEWRAKDQAVTAAH